MNTDSIVEAINQGGDLSELLAREEAKRERNWDPAERWRVIQATITWAAEQETVRRNTHEACRKKEAMFLAGLQGQLPKTVD